LRPLRHFCRDSWASEIKQIESILMLIGWPGRTSHECAL
jgi:hypothetical protein